MRHEKVSDPFPGADGGGAGTPARATAEPPLAERELAVLRVLVERQGRVVTRQELARRAGLRDLQPRRVDVLLVGVRKLVGADNLVNVRSRGWMLVHLPAAAADLLASGGVAFETAS